MAAARIDAMRESVSDALRRLRGNDVEPAGCFFVPGRIEVLGKHTDYAGGRSLLAAVDRGFVIAAARRSDNVVRVIDSMSGGFLEIADGVGTAAALPPWATYPLTVLRRCTRNFPSATGGADLAFESDLPQAAGLSSSSALVVATFLALDAVRAITTTKEYRDAIHDSADLAGYLGAVENGLSFRTLAGDAGVGTMGGSEDHTAILCARPGRLVQYSYAPVRFEADVLLPSGWTFAIGSSGVRAEKAGATLARYNRLASSARRLVQLWKEAGAGAQTTLAGIIASDADAQFRLREIVRQRAGGEEGELLARIEQFVAESEDIVPGACTALRRGDITGFSVLARRSQHYAEHVLYNQTAETMHLVERAHALGAAATSSFGAGFGGSVWALVRADRAHEFIGSWRSAYIARFAGRGSDARFFTTPAAAPATRLTRDEP
jgi:galactokinase